MDVDVNTFAAMPIALLQSNRPASPQSLSTLFQECTTLLATAFGRPESVVFLSFSQSALFLGGSEEPAAYLEVRSVSGIDPHACRELSGQLGERIFLHLQIPLDRIYLQYNSVSPESAWIFKTGKPRTIAELQS